MRQKLMSAIGLLAFFVMPTVATADEVGTERLTSVLRRNQMVR